jgi:hypothetical protein
MILVFIDRVQEIALKPLNFGYEFDRYGSVILLSSVRAFLILNYCGRVFA